ncbi:MULTISPECIES: PTS-dependent dihydroxyacetone kinase phosphotransferase subunit DhaM [Leptotrichia]|jgi:PTS system fructose subfamily IIA component|uniref:PTS system fructose subfamily IIA component n=2 Tax=Leptotrichia TaxID=32067 RepID=C7N9T3_LEPBD|nr:diguanylate cyclase [Leptotrichia buccalis]ACV38914.1 PTS system fructose subfamily IIA component [Leptotrichia buccalis C-1013-b]
MEEKNKKIVGIVVVSHSNKLAEEIINFVKIFKQTDFPLENGGNANREVYGTNIENVKNAIIRADNGAGVLVFVDMGSSVFNAVKAIKELDGEVEAKIADAPLVEGIISAVAANFDGIDLDELKIIAEDSKKFTKLKKKI